MAAVMNLVRAAAPELEKRAMPDSTTIVERVEFAVGEDILLKKDGKFYLGTAVEVDAVREQCFIKFGDNTDCWSCFTDLVKLSAPEELMCVVCKKSAPTSRNEIRACDRCGRGYHQRCHQPYIPCDSERDDSGWICNRCAARQQMRSKRKLSSRHEPHSESESPCASPRSDARTPTCDTSGDDDASSKSTLDLIIPPPKDFEGRNNPFRASPRAKDARKRRCREPPATAPVVRSLKRQLSEKDIFVGPNGEVKRRRMRRARPARPTFPSSTTMTASKTATVLPARPCADWQQQLIDVVPQPTAVTAPMLSPTKSEPGMSMHELKHSVHSYFGAATRIQDGEQFTVKAKRFGPTGKLEYLMEWEGVNSSLQQ